MKGIENTHINMGNYLIIIVCLLLTSNFYMQTIIGANIDRNTSSNETESATTATTLGAVNSTKSTRYRHNNGTLVTFKGELLIFSLICIY